MKYRIKHLMAAGFCGLFLAIPSAKAAITYTGGLGDLTFYYESAADRWDIVFQNKGSTVAEGNDNEYAGFTGIVGGSTSNRTFSTLQINVTSSPLLTMGGIDYLVTSASGSTYANLEQPDLGIRTRLREDFGDGVVQQFTNMRMTLDWDNSIRPTGAEFSMFRTNAITSVTQILFSTADDDFSHDWLNWEHQHYHFGFSEVGDYQLRFTIDGIGGVHGDNDTPSSFILNFNVVPEPSAALLGMVALGMLGLRRRR